MKVYRRERQEDFDDEKATSAFDRPDCEKLRDADAMLAAGKSVGEVLQALGISEPTLSRWRAQYGGMKKRKKHTPGKGNWGTPLRKHHFN